MMAPVCWLTIFGFYKANGAWRRMQRLDPKLALEVQSGVLGYTFVARRGHARSPGSYADVGVLR